MIASSLPSTRVINFWPARPEQQRTWSHLAFLFLRYFLLLRSSAVHCHSTFIPACRCNLLHWFHNLSFSKEQSASSNLLTAVAFKRATSEGVFSAHCCPASFPPLHSLHRLLLLVSEHLSKTIRSALSPTSSSFITTAPSSPLVQT